MFFFGVTLIYGLEVSKMNRNMCVKYAKSAKILNFTNIFEHIERIKYNKVLFIFGTCTNFNDLKHPN